MYRQSLLGIIWAFIPPLMTALVWVFLNGKRIINIEDPGIPYPAFALTSVLLWSVFAQAMQSPLQTMQQGKQTMTKINFPKEALVMAALLQVMFDFLVKLILISGVLIAFKVVPAATALLVIPGGLSLVLLGMSVGVLLLPIGMLYIDIQKMVVTVLPFLMLLTPVIYPTPRGEVGPLLIKYNPITPLLSATRDWLFIGGTEFLFPFLWISGVSLVLFLLGILVLRLAIPIIIERAGS